MKQMIKYNLKHLWSEHKLFVSVVAVLLLIAIILWLINSVIGFLVGGTNNVKR
jgi:hypothetical protein